MFQILCDLKNNTEFTSFINLEIHYLIKIMIDFKLQVVNVDKQTFFKNLFSRLIEQSMVEFACWDI